VIPVHLDRACDAAPVAEVAPILRVELLGRLVEDSSPADADHVAIDCAADFVILSVSAPGGVRRSMKINVGVAPANVRARIVALSLAELIRDLDREAAAAPPAPLPPPPPPAPPPPLPAPESTPEHAAIDVAAFAQASTFRLDGAWLAGGGLRFDYVRGWASVGFDVATLTMSERFAPGTAQALLAYASPYVAWRAGWGPLRTRLGAGFAVGAARLAGHATDATAFAGTTAGAWTAPFAFASMQAKISARISLDARGQLGWVTSPVVGEVAGAPDLALDGPWLSVQLGAAITL